MLGQLQGETVFLQDLRIGPALGAIELGDDGDVVLNAHLIDPVFIGVEGDQAQVTAIAQGFDAVDNGIGGQCVIGMGHGGSIAVKRPTCPLPACAR